MNRGTFLLACSLLFVFSCSTPRQTTVPPPVSPGPTVPAPPSPPPLKPAPEPPPESRKEPPIQPTPEPSSSKEVSTSKVEDENVKITQEEYKKTFQEVERVIEELNSIIKVGAYHRWEQYLTPKFIASVMDPENLKKINEQPLLKRNKIEIKTLHDYFMYVVVPSRASVRLDDLIFTDQNKVKAFMFVRQDPVLIYQLEKIGETWKISVW